MTPSLILDGVAIDIRFSHFIYKMLNVVAEEKKLAREVPFRRICRMNCYFRRRQAEYEPSVPYIDIRKTKDV
jgi:hypothetical protein